MFWMFNGDIGIPTKSYNKIKKALIYINQLPAILITIETGGKLLRHSNLVLCIDVVATTETVDIKLSYAVEIRTKV